MQIPRISIVCLGVSDLNTATRFYATVLGTPPNTSNDGITFIELPGTWLSLYPFEELARDISSDVPTTRAGFGGFTLAYNARSRERVTVMRTL